MWNGMAHVTTGLVFTPSSRAIRKSWVNGKIDLMYLIFRPNTSTFLLIQLYLYLFRTRCIIFGFILVYLKNVRLTCVEMWCSLLRGAKKHLLKTLINLNIKLSFLCNHLFIKQGCHGLAGTVCGKGHVLLWMFHHIKSIGSNFHIT